MKTKIIAILTALILFAVLFSACGGPLPTASPSPTATTAPTAAPTSTPTPQLPMPIPTPDFPTPFSDIAPSGFDSVFWYKIQELTDEYFMGIQYLFLDIDGDGDDELVVDKLGAQFNTLSIFEKNGGEAALSVKGDRFYINGQGGLVAHSAHLSAGSYHLYHSGYSEESALEYQLYSLGSSKVSDDDTSYYLIANRAQSYIDISNYYDGRRSEEFIVYEWATGEAPIGLSPYLIDEGEYRTLLGGLLEGYTEFEPNAHKNYVSIPAREFRLNDKPGKIIIDYADDDFLVFHGGFGLFVYNFEQGRITASFDSGLYLDRDADRVRVDYLKAEGTQYGVLQLSSHSGRDPSRVYLLDLLTGLCSIESYDAQFETFETQEDGSVLFDDGTSGEILCDDSGTIEGLYYIRGDDMLLLFEK